MIRSDAPLKLVGGAEYGTDLAMPGMLWAAIVPAPIAHGRIRSLDLSPARGMPDVRAVVGPEEVASLLAGGTLDPERPVFPTQEILYRGQPVAAVAAESLAAARAAARAVRVEVDPLPVALDLDELFPEWPGPEAPHSPHVIGHVRAGRGDLAEAFRTAEFVHSEVYRTAGVHQVALEPHACLATVEDGHWRVWTSTQTPFGLREDVASMLGIPESSLVVHGTWVGGGFGGKTSAFVEPYALVLAAASGRPVKLSLSFREEFLLGRTTLSSVIRLESAVSGGRVTARRVRLLLDTGSSLPGRDFATGYAIGFLLGPYRCDTFEMEGYAVRTNKPPFGPHRAPFAPQCAFVADSHMDSIARRLAVDPTGFRLEHVWREGDSTPMGQSVGPFGLAKCLEAARETARIWRAELGGRETVGIGVGCGFWSTNAGAGGEARLRLTSETLVIEQGEREIGSGSVVGGLVAVAMRVLSIPADAVRVEYRDTSTSPFDSGVFGSRTVAALGQAVEKAARGIARELEQRLGVSGPVRLERRNGSLFVHGGPTERPVSEILTGAERDGEGMTAAGAHYAPPGTIDESRVKEGAFYPYTDFAGAAHVALAEVDRETGSVRVLRYAAFHDAGEVLDPAMFRGQVEGGVAMGLGAALTEETLWAPDGRLLNPTLLDYRIPTFGEVPPIEVHAVAGFPGAGPFGIKGMGEPPIIPVPAAVGNAIADATGVRVTELPMTAERVARALKLLP